MYWIAVVSLLIAAVCDHRTRQIPDAVPALLFLLAVAAKLLGLHPVPWGELGLGAGGAFLGGTMLFAAGGLGGGDVKLLTALGAALGAAAFLPFILLTGVLGGLVALAVRQRCAELAYAPIMFLGLLALLPLTWIAR